MSHLLSPALGADALLDVLGARYATKIFDSTRKIDDATWNALEQSLVLAPSSFGLQPWKFVVVTDEQLKAQLRPHAWNQESITSCSHLVVCYAQNVINSDDVQKLIGLTADVRHMERASLDGYASMIGASISQLSPAEMLVWNKRQVYIALGQLMVSAALLGVDTCPLEGFVGPEFEALLPVEGFSATVLCAVGYRSPDDKYGDLPKIRYERSEIIEHR